MKKKKTTTKKKKTDYLGQAKKEINNLLDELVVAGKVTKDEGEKFLKKFWKETEDERGILKEKLGKTAQDLRQKIDAPTREEFETLKKRVEILEKRQ